MRASTLVEEVVLAVSNMKMFSGLIQKVEKMESSDNFLVIKPGANMKKTKSTLNQDQMKKWQWANKRLEI